jgi:hypothetical protein
MDELGCDVSHLRTASIFESDGAKSIKFQENYR